MRIMATTVAPTMLLAISTSTKVTAAKLMVPSPMIAIVVMSTEKLNSYATLCDLHEMENALGGTHGVLYPDRVANFALGI